MADLKELAGRRIQDLGLSPPVERALRDIQAEIAEAYRQAFLHVVDTLAKQTSTIERMQTTLQMVLQRMPAVADDKLPAAFRIADSEEAPDVASVHVIADPVAAGYTMSAKELAESCGITPQDLSPLLKEFDFKSDGKLAVVVRKGKSREIVNYHPRASERLRDLLDQPPSALSKTAAPILARIRKRRSTSR